MPERRRDKPICILHPFGAGQHGERSAGVPVIFNGGVGQLWRQAGSLVYEDMPNVHNEIERYEMRSVSSTIKQVVIDLDRTRGSIEVEHNQSFYLVFAIGLSVLSVQA